MNKIIQAINKIIQDQENITNVFKANTITPALSEYYFKYKDYKWSISKGVNEDGDDSFYLHYYPTKNLSIEDISLSDWENYKEFITYKSDDDKTQESIESYRELYQTVQKKIYDFDKVLNDIIGQ